MRRAISVGLFLVAFATLFALESRAATPNKNALATITGSVRDTKGNPLCGALVSLVREGARRFLKETKTDFQGNFIAKVSPGRYGIKATANGFNEVIFSSVEVRASQELVYRFNLEPVGSGRTLPERRKDREDVKWTLRSAQTRRSIFQAQEGEDATVAAVEEVENSDTETPPVEIQSDPASHSSRPKTRGVLENYLASSTYGPAYVGLNFAVSTPVSERVELIFAGQTGLGSEAPQRFEASSRMRVDAVTKECRFKGGLKLIGGRCIG